MDGLIFLVVVVYSGILFSMGDVCVCVYLSHLVLLPAPFSWIEFVVIVVRKLR